MMQLAEDGLLRSAASARAAPQSLSAREARQRRREVGVIQQPIQ